MRHRRGRIFASLVAGPILAGCVLGPTPTATPSPTPSATGTPAGESQPPSSSPEPTPSPTPAFALALPASRDPRAVEVSVEPSVDTAGGELLVTITNPTDDRIDEVVLRWTTDLDDTLFLAPFEPSGARIRDGGPPLVQDWTKWVIGPGERGEPEGTTSLGYGPILPGATLAIAILVERRDPDPVSFDLQVLSGNDLLQLAGGGPAALRIEVP